jgi:small-conductance mechanosensitive channel
MEGIEILQMVKPSGLPYGLLILLVMVLLVRILTRSGQRLGNRFPDKRLVINQIGSFLRFGTYLAGCIGASASVLHLQREVLLALAGTIAVSVGFALKDFAASIVAGLIILVDRPFQVGDRVLFDGYYGEIRHIGLRSVRLVTLDDTQVAIPNNKFLTESVASANAGALEMMIELDFYTAIDQDLVTAKRLVEEALTSSRYVDLKLDWSVTMSQVIHESYFAVRFRARAYVLDVRFEKEMESDVTERILAAFAEAGIQPPAVLHRSTGDTRSSGESG